MKTTFSLLAVAAASIFGGAHSHAGTAYFLMSGPVESQDLQKAESYVVAVSDAALIKQARDYLAAGGGIPLLVPHVGIASGPDPLNLNHAEPGHPVWPWHTTTLIDWTTYDPSLPRAAVFIPNIDGAPSSVPQLLAGDSMQPPVNSMSLIHYPLVMELDPGNAAAVVNVSARAWVGPGERVLIAGFIVHGGEPRNVVVRGIGPSLAQYDVNEPLANPRVAVFCGTKMIAENDDWQNGNFVHRPEERPGVPEPPPWYTGLFPFDPKEAAIQLSLRPGCYTVHVSGVGDTTGIALAEVYDLDALKPSR